MKSSSTISVWALEPIATLHSVTVELGAYPVRNQHYWMDQICINQQDMAEKGKQVANMGDIYRRAKAVFACVGAHADDSQFILDTIKGLDMDEFETLPNDSPCVLRQGLIHQHLERKGQPDKNFERTRSALEKFAIRPYWTRLWILQEIFLSSATVVLCGDDSVSIDHLSEFWDIAKYYNIVGTSSHSRAPPETIQHVLRRSGKKSMSLPDALRLCVDLGCVDRRDTVYGIRAMVHWAANLGPPDVDYKINTSDLYMKISRYLNNEDFSIGNHKTQIPDLYMIRDIFNISKDDDRFKVRGRALASHRLLYKALYGTNIDGATVRDILQHWVDADNSQIELPAADLIYAWQTALQPRPKNQTFNEFAKEWKRDPRAHILDEESSYSWRGMPVEDASKRFASTRLTGLRPS
ncbi:heterokaryon incompatibility protein-domain-containing protein [Paraphoma chrysanthemicola]|uniref:Heterokaryon incompatibility protein-domain-containing protein n=1 Tax=Paraphoma chrysanthemicola TaxID=798071 RepID=A0A8K0QXN5_9PLEO|nr:heterokaryon incompatibility protein-domain-containing protein [Paraphoma chrysanthemicola]